MDDLAMAAAIAACGAAPLVAEFGICGWDMGEVFLLRIGGACCSCGAFCVEFRF